MCIMMKFLVIILLFYFFKLKCCCYFLFQYNINSYPSAILYKNSVGHKYHGSYHQNELQEFIQVINLKLFIFNTNSSRLHLQFVNKNQLHLKCYVIFIFNQNILMLWL